MGNIISVDQETFGFIEKISKCNKKELKIIFEEYAKDVNFISFLQEEMQYMDKNDLDELFDFVPEIFYTHFLPQKRLGEIGKQIITFQNKTRVYNTPTLYQRKRNSYSLNTKLLEGIDSDNNRTLLISTPHAFSKIPIWLIGNPNVLAASSIFMVLDFINQNSDFDSLIINSNIKMNQSIITRIFANTLAKNIKIVNDHFYVEKIIKINNSKLPNKILDSINLRLNDMVL